jgi:hypothetical protein
MPILLSLWKFERMRVLSSEINFTETTRPIKNIKKRILFKYHGKLDFSGIKYKNLQFKGSFLESNQPEKEDGTVH